MTLRIRTQIGKNKHTLTHREQRKSVKIKSYRILTLLFLMLVTLFTHLPTPSQAHTLEPYIKEYVVYPGQTFDDGFNFTNTNETDSSFKLSVENYNAITEQPIKENDEDIFVSIKENSLSFPPTKPTEVRYSIAIPESTTPGTYFNILYLEEVVGNAGGDQTVGINLGFGMITVFHVIPEGTSTRDLMKNTVQTQLELTKKGLPFIQESEITYTMNNRSNFVIKPIVEIRIFDAETGELLLTEKRDEKELDTLSSENRSLTIPVSTQLYDLDNITHGFKVVSRSYNQLDTEYVENTLLIPGYPVVYLAIALLALLIIIWLVIKVLGKLLGKKKSKKAAKKAAETTKKNSTK